MDIIAIVILYFFLLFAVSRWTGRRATNETFYRGDKRSPWYLVAFGMIGASISGVTFISVPGMVNSIGMTYLQTCLGFMVGYVVIAFVLLPLYYRLNLTTIYSYLGQRIGQLLGLKCDFASANSSSKFPEQEVPFMYMKTKKISFTFVFAFW